MNEVRPKKLIGGVFRVRSFENDVDLILPQIAMAIQYVRPAREPSDIDDYNCVSVKRPAIASTTNSPRPLPKSFLFRAISHAIVLHTGEALGSSPQIAMLLEWSICAHLDKGSW
jgi:hypothetical protein